MLLSNVHFSYQPHLPVIRGISGALDSGGVCALIGPNAAGKSTLMKLMLGQLDPSQGQITLDGLSIAKMKPHERAARVAYVPQRTTADVAFTVAEVVALGRFALPRSESAIAQAMEMCDLLSIRHRVFAELSTGQQQRVALARALAQVGPADAMRGKFLLLDEPVSAMDLKHVHDTMSRLRLLASNGLGVLVVLHDLNLTATYADSVWLMDDGLLRAAGRWDAVLQSELLEPVYGLRLQMQTMSGQARPMFVAAGRE